MKIPQGHEIGNEPTSTTPATCEDNEKKYYKCKNCEESVCIEQSGTSLGHLYEKNDSGEEVWIVEKEPTDTESGCEEAHLQTLRSHRYQANSFKEQLCGRRAIMPAAAETKARQIYSV